jgi:hypothetical protein
MRTFNMSTAVRKPEDETGAPEGTGPVTKTPREKIADRDWINDAGEVVEEEQATGVRYKFLGRTKDGITEVASGKSFAVYFRDLAPAALNMGCGMGLLTRFGNLTNTWLTDKSTDRAPFPEDLMASTIALMNSGQWIDRTGTTGPRVDRDALAQAIVDQAESLGRALPLAAVRQRLEDQPDWLRAMKDKPEVASRYNSLVGKASKSFDELFAGL